MMEVDNSLSNLTGVKTTSDLRSQVPESWSQDGWLCHDFCGHPEINGRHICWREVLLLLRKVTEVERVCCGMVGLKCLSCSFVSLSSGIERLLKV
ncbi:hypothetical protein CEXT_454371 [Caerostris extrusa]|uniref:Uncharacterized protein n=1 Tax=Caerostris extrusa TaxID=172846 RepID=A0AAV4MX07_CAEEX|nr:hypothetical protein CEXT_454371 [Caerostris extrusa]